MEKTEIPKTKYGLSIYRNPNPEIFEIGVDEAGKGPMFGRVYAAAVVLPKDPEQEMFNYTDLRDSKKIKSLKKLKTTAEYIKENALAWAVSYCDEKEIDLINIRQATFKAMHNAIESVVGQLERLEQSKKDNVANLANLANLANKSSMDIQLMIDGNDFKPYMCMQGSMFLALPHTCYEGGDNRFTSIAAASILAKTERDIYILDLCEKNPELKERYSIDTNKGYGTKKHLEGIQEFGITEWHRRSYGICKNY
jgi:ribonuclease HII